MFINFQSKQSEMKMRSQKGFSLIELVVVITIMAILAGVVVVRIMDEPDKARVTKAKADMAELKVALNLYKADNFKFPTSDQGLDALVKKPNLAPVPKQYKKGGYIETLPKDPWGNAYHYLSPGKKGKDYDLYSLGADNATGGEEADADIYLN